MNGKGKAEGGGQNRVVTGRHPAPGGVQAIPSETEVDGKGKSAEREAEEAERSSSDEVGGDSPEPVSNVHWCQLEHVRGDFMEEVHLSVKSSAGTRLTSGITVLVTSTKFLKERSVIQITSTGNPKPMS